MCDDLTLPRLPGDSCKAIQAVSQALLMGVSLVEIPCTYPFKLPSIILGMRVGINKHIEDEWLC